MCSDMISVTNVNKKKFDFSTKSMEKPLWKIPFFGPC